MPIKIPDALPAVETLAQENIFVMTEFRAIHQHIRPLSLLILNLMPTKIVTETQILRKLSNTPLQIEVQLLQTASYIPQHVDTNHLESFYRTFDQVRDSTYDGMIITGAPVENREFDQVDYWDELCEIMDWTKTNVHSTLHICWGAQAGLYHHYGIPKRTLPEKLFGIYSHRVIKKESPWFRGFDDRFYAPHSRYTTIDPEDVAKVPDLAVYAVSDEAGIFALKSEDNRHFFVLGHPEYDSNTLALEYQRDVERGLDIHVPRNYFPNDDPTQAPIVNWRSAGQLLYTNWLNYYVYQTTPYNLKDIGASPRP